MTALTLASGLTISEPEARLQAFCTEEWDYYDALIDNCPNEITALDMLAPVSV